MNQYTDSEVPKVISRKIEMDEDAHLLRQTSGMRKSQHYPVVDPISSAEKFMEDIKKGKAS